MGRTKGSKNGVRKSESDLSTAVSMVGVTEPVKRERKSSLPVNTEWILTETSGGTPVAIVGIARDGITVHFIVIPNYKDSTSRTTVDSKDLFKPEMTCEQAKEFEGVTWYIPPAVPPNEPPEE